jgi:hypothetical protein
MQVENSKKWVVLIDKSPRGPFTQDEIDELLSQGLLKRNDLGLLVSDPTSTDSVELGSWKFLWQFSCFDLRLKSPTPPPPAVLEKRIEKSEAEIVQTIGAGVPLDLKSIRIEELIVKAGQSPKREFSFAKITENKNDEASSEEAQGSALASGTASLFFVIVALFGMGWIGYREITKIRTDASKPVSREAASSEPSSSKAAVKTLKAPEARKVGGPMPPTLGVDKPGISTDIPRARDRGDIREEELLRAREEERRREAEERERTAREEEEERKKEDAQESDDEDKDKLKKRKARSRRELGSEENDSPEESSDSSSEPQEVLEE